MCIIIAYRKKRHQQRPIDKEISSVKITIQLLKWATKLLGVVSWLFNLKFQLKIGMRAGSPMMDVAQTEWT